MKTTLSVTRGAARELQNEGLTFTADDASPSCLYKIKLVKYSAYITFFRVDAGPYLGQPHCHDISNGSDSG